MLHLHQRRDSENVFYTEFVAFWWGVRRFWVQNFLRPFNATAQSRLNLPVLKEDSSVVSRAKVVKPHQGLTALTTRSGPSAQALIPKPKLGEVFMPVNTRSRPPDCPPGPVRQIAFKVRRLQQIARRLRHCLPLLMRPVPSTRFAALPPSGLRRWGPNRTP